MEDILSSIEQEQLTFDQRGDAYTTLHKVLANISKNPSEQKFRSLKKDNKLISEKLGRSTGAVSTLLALGFEDIGAVYSLPADADLAALTDVVELLECIIASRGPVEASSPASAPAGSPAAAASKTLARRDEAEKKREEATGQLGAIRAAQRAQFADGGGAGAALRAAAPVAALTAEARGATSAGTGTKPKSAFDFENRSKKEQQAQKVESSLEELRRHQREKFKEFEANPDARNSEAYKQPASVVAGGKVEQGWGDWVGSMFGGSSSSGGGGSKSKPPDDRPKPRMKTINDLPKPVQKG